MPTDLFEKLPLKSIPQKVKEEAIFGQWQNPPRSNVWKWKLCEKVIFKLYLSRRGFYIYGGFPSSQSFSINILVKYFDDRYFKRKRKIKHFDQ